MSDKPTGSLAVAENHARACFNVLDRHTKGLHCTCRWEETTFMVSPNCLTGAHALEEYELATARVRGLKTPKPTTPR